MRAKEANGFGVWLSVGGEKLSEQRLGKIEKENGRIRMECYVCPVPHEDLTINMQLGRQKPWTGDWIAIPWIDGKRIHAFHVRKRWHVTHKMTTFFKEINGDMMECNLTSGNIVNPTFEDFAEGVERMDFQKGIISVLVYRGDIEKEKPTRKRISTRSRDDEPEFDERQEIASGSRHKVAKKAVYNETFHRDKDDRKHPFLTFVFKEYLIDNEVVDEAPAQQHPCQVSEAIRLKAEPDEELNQSHAEVSAPSISFTARPVNTNRHAKRELSDDSVRFEPQRARRGRPY
ncbi:uncharacterized protein I206_102583 [Kwoniella pini CBS 10737]|uniref:Uncharacterized protein n=1 Tax=Kwoniella pini CBS 10737 TaxID=1296096 RepID=A0AAJ8L244_9TREE